MVKFSNSNDSLNDVRNRFYESKKIKTDFVEEQTNDYIPMIVANYIERIDKMIQAIDRHMKM